MIKLSKVNQDALALSFLILSLYGSDVVANNYIQAVNANLRLGYINIEASDGIEKTSSAIGGQLGVITQDWHGISAGATLYTTQKLVNDEVVDFFSSEHKGYTIVGEAYLQADLNHSQTKLGRFEFDSPYADSDDIRMIPNTVSGVMVSNTGIQDTTVYFAHFNRWAGVDTEKPESFTPISGQGDLTLAGVEYTGIKNVFLHAWFYHGKETSNIFYAEAAYEKDQFSLAVQFGRQSDNAIDNSGPDGEVYGVKTQYALSEFTFSAAYNHVEGTVVDGYGGGPYYTSSADHTIHSTPNQKAFALGVTYTGINNVVLSVQHFDFNKGADELDYTLLWQTQEHLSIEVIYHQKFEEGDMLLAVFNYTF